MGDNHAHKYITRRNKKFVIVGPIMKNSIASMFILTIIAGFAIPLLWLSIYTGCSKKVIDF